MQETFSEGYWDGRAERYSRIYKGSKRGLEKLTDNLLRWHFRTRLEVTFHYLKDVKGKSMLDVGCGPGVYLTEALKRGAARVMGIDISSAMLKCASDSLSREFSKDERWQLVKQNIIEFKTDGKFDVVLAIGVVEYLDPPETCMKVLARLSGTILVCSFPARFSWYNQLRNLSGRSPRIRLYSEHRIKSLAEQASLRIHRFRSIGPTYFVAMIPERGQNA